MRHHLTTEIQIEAPIEVVWQILVDLDRYVEWNPFIVSAAGDVSLGGMLRNRMQPPGGRSMTFTPTITELVDGSVLEWLGRLGVPGIFDGRHRFELHSLPNGATHVTHAETFSGVLVRLMRRSLEGGTRAGFVAMNEAWRQRVVEAVRSS